MERLFRRLLCLMIFSLLVSAGGVAPSQTLSAFIAFDDLASGSPIKTPHTEQLQAAYSVANRPQVALVRQVAPTADGQHSLIGRNRSKTLQTSPLYAAAAISFFHFYPEGFSPPPRSSTFI